VGQAFKPATNPRNTPLTHPFLTSALSLLVVGTFATAAFAETRAIDLGTFTAAAFESNLSAKIVVGGEQSVTIEGANPADLDDVRFEIINGRLRAWRDTDIWDFLALRRDDVLITITVPALSGIEASGASDVDAVGISGDALNVAVSSASSVVISDAAVNSAAIEVSSAGQLTISGKSTTARIETSSSGMINARGFEVVDVDITASSASRTLMFASGLVTANASSAALIEISGHPLHVDDEVSSGADVNILQ
jgi:hypothetical protein